MEHNKTLGIYVGPEKTTVAVVAKTGGKIEILQQFCISSAIDEQTSPDSLGFYQIAKDIAAVCREKQINYGDVAVALDCRLYRQQVLHSEFEEVRQIAQTIKFDAEEALAINAANTAVAFEIAGKGLSGSEVSTYAVDAAIISEIIMALGNNKLDPVTIEPDSVCFRRMVQHLPGFSEKTNTMWMGVSEKKCFVLSVAAPNTKQPIRAFLTAAAQNKIAMIAREIMLTTASAAKDTQIQEACIYAQDNGVSLEELKHQSSVAIEKFDFDSLFAADIEQNDCQQMDAVIAASAAVSLLIKGGRVDFRPDFMPYQGKKAILEGIAKVVSIAFVLLFISLGVFLHMQYYKTNSYRNKLTEKFKTEYSIAMTGAKFRNSKEALSRLKREINRIKDVKSGLLSAAGADSVEAKLTALFEAMNSVDSRVDIEIDKISVTTKTMSITGSTSSRGYLKLFAAIDKHPKLSKGQATYDPKDGRDHFRVTVELKQ